MMTICAKVQTLCNNNIHLIISQEDYVGNDNVSVKLFTSRK